METDSPNFLFLQFYPSGNAIITGSDDCTCKMYDLRADQEVICYQDAALNSGVTSLALSMSGRLIFAGYDDFNCNIWDSLKGEKVGELKERSDLLTLIKEEQSPSLNSRLGSYFLCSQFLSIKTLF